jgi:hypothetical protein
MVLDFNKKRCFVMKKMVLFVIVSGLLWACSHHKVENVERAFYFWKNKVYRFSNKEDTLLKKLKIKKIYIKFFEVEKDKVMGSIPVAKSEFHNYGVTNIIFVPTVYIRNEVFIKTSNESLDTLANNINFLILKKLKTNFGYNGSNSISEFQIDCDWTIKSKENYFYFLKKLKEISKKKISCTLRLYPYKYPDKMGVPPVDKATLMCYNLINPLENKNKNSILDLDELSSYLNSKQEYPIHLDVALPIYSWMQVYQNNHFSKIIYDPNTDIKNNLEQESKLWFTVKRDTLIDDCYLRIGDKVKLEEMDAENIGKAIVLIKKKVRFDKNTTITLFHLEENHLKKYSNEELASFYTDFSK